MKLRPPPLSSRRFDGRVTHEAEAPGPAEELALLTLASPPADAAGADATATPPPSGDGGGARPAPVKIDGFVLWGAEVDPEYTCCIGRFKLRRLAPDAGDDGRGGDEDPSEPPPEPR